MDKVIYKMERKQYNYREKRKNAVLMGLRVFTQSSVTADGGKRRANGG